MDYINTDDIEILYSVAEYLMREHPHTKYTLSKAHKYVFENEPFLRNTSLKYIFVHYFTTDLRALCPKHVCIRALRSGLMCNR